MSHFDLVLENGKEYKIFKLRLNSVCYKHKCFFKGRKGVYELLCSGWSPMLRFEKSKSFELYPVYAFYRRNL